jgi:cytochrome c oxidase subunit III
VKKQGSIYNTQAREANVFLYSVSLTSLPRLIRFGLFGYNNRKEQKRTEKNRKEQKRTDKIYFYLFYIVGELAFITFGHHALIAGNRKAAINGVILTIILAVIFTALQYFEYTEAGFTISDGVYGSAFYASTGLHGLITIVPIKLKK